jgi:N-acetylglucosaminyldiphosphoundecaprenol N-acetyl-beta-D-mannosaminyltransferase
LGVGVSAINMALALETIEGWISRREAHYICVTNVHSIMECQRDPALRRVYNAAGLVTPDGMPLVWLCRMAGLGHVGRVYGPDLMLTLCASSPGYRHFLYGGQGDVTARLAANLQGRFAGLQIAGSYAPPFRALSGEEDDQVVRLINESGADIVWVGLGTAKQERWMADHAGRLSVPVLIGVGAAFDFLAGVKPQAPRWMRENGLEWCFRLFSEPRRLWRRYLLDSPHFVALVLAQMLRLRRYSID